MRGAPVGNAADDHGTSTDSSSRAGESAPAPLQGAAPRSEGPVEVPPPVIISCSRCGCECYDYHSAGVGHRECLHCVADDRVAQAHRIDALTAELQDARRKLAKVVDLYLAEVGREPL